MSDHLVTLFEHNLWANTTILLFCADMDDRVLDVSNVGLYGSIRQILLHIVNSEADYYALLASTPTEFLEAEEGIMPTIPGMAAFYQKFGEGLIRCARDIPDQLMLDGTFDDGLKFRFPASGVFIQAINHGTEHRTQIAGILTHHQIEPPQLDGWFYVDHVMMPGGAWEK